MKNVAKNLDNEDVAPRRGAWIETICGILTWNNKECRAPPGRVD